MKKKVFGKYRVNSPDELIEILEKDYDYSVINEFRNKYIMVDTEKCANKLANFIKRLINNEQVEEIYNTNFKEERTV